MKSGKRPKDTIDLDTLKKGAKTLKCINWKSKIRHEERIAYASAKRSGSYHCCIRHLAQRSFAGKKLEGEYDGARSLRVWPYRIIYVIYQDIVTVVVLRVAHRQSVYNK